MDIYILNVFQKVWDGRVWTLSVKLQKREQRILIWSELLCICGSVRNEFSVDGGDKSCRWALRFHMPWEQEILKVGGAAVCNNQPFHFDGEAIFILHLVQVRFKRIRRQ